MPTTNPDLNLDGDPGSQAPSREPGAGAATRFDEGCFRALLRRWNRHQDLRRDGADVATLSRSREVLDAAREALRSAPYGRGA